MKLQRKLVARTHKSALIFCDVSHVTICEAARTPWPVATQGLGRRWGHALCNVPKMCCELCAFHTRALSHRSAARCRSNARIRPLIQKEAPERPYADQQELCHINALSPRCCDPQRLPGCAIPLSSAHATLSRRSVCIVPPHSLNDVCVNRRPKPVEPRNCTARTA